MMSKIDVICDQSQKSLEEVPRNVLDMNNLQMLYLEGNSIKYLPSNLFQMLPKLTWLDLRNNQLKEIPNGIAHHQYLDTLLLENNELEKLPNELGLCPSLLVLQINGNPLTYPCREILEQGAVKICEFLKSQFEKENPLGPLLTQNTNFDVSAQSESASCPSEPVRLPGKKKISVQELLRKASAAAKIFHKDVAVMTVKSLSPKNSTTKPTYTEKNEGGVICEEEPGNSKNKKKLAKYCPKLSVNSHYNSNKYLNAKKSRPNRERVVDHELKNIWLSKLKELLDQQERLLQQERNLQALNSWRLQKRMEPIRRIPQQKMEVPYDTDPQYDTMVQREDLYKQVDNMVRKKKRFTKTVDMRKMISELVLQLKAMETKSAEPNELGTREVKTLEDCIMDESNVMNPAEARAFQLMKAENEIRKIIDLHKKVTSLQAMNDTSV